MITEEQRSDMELATEDAPKIQAPEIQIQKVSNEEGNEAPRRYYRRRKKALFAAILKQMEFYFSDSNLSKDRFFADQVKECPDVPIEIFLKCNKIRSLTTEAGDIAGALRKSTILEVSKDGTTVRRTTPISEKNNVDDCTVYVQRLPPNADHEWMQSQFSKYGKVNYVSIPKFTHTNKIKGFAFVEFDSPEEVEKCLKDFKAKGGILPSETPPEKMLSITTFQDQEKQEENNSTEKPKSTSNEEEDDKYLESDITKSKKKKKKKNKHSDLEKPETYQPEDVDTKVDAEIDEQSEKRLDDLDIVKEDKKSKKKKHDIQDSETDHQSDFPKAKKKKDDEESDSNTVGGERKRKRKIVHEEHESSEAEETECSKSKIKKESDKDSDVCPPESKIEGEDKRKKRKNKHSCEEVSASDAEVPKTVDENGKKHKKSRTEESDVTETESDANEVEKAENGEEVESEKKKKRKKRNRNYHSAPTVTEEHPLMGIQVMAKPDWKRLRNKYLNLQRTKMKQLKQHLRKVKWNKWGDKNKVEKMETNVEEAEIVNPATKLEFAPGLIVKVELNEPCIDPKSFKTELKSSNNNIKYVDIKDGSNEAYVRCDSAEAATLLSQTTSENKHFKILTGKEEVCYWDQIKKDREEKRSKNVRQNVRGRIKLLKKAEKELGKHIKFDD